MRSPATRMEQEGAEKLQQAPLFEGGIGLQRRPDCTRPRWNKDSPLLHVPNGFFLCPRATCGQLLPNAQLRRRFARCSGGHVIDWDAEEKRHRDAAGGISKSGLTNTAQGIIAEEVVWDLKDLGEYGLITIRTDSRCPFDFVTDRNCLVEVRSASNRTLNQAFCPTAERKRRMDRYAAERGALLQVGILVILNFSSLTADIYVRPMPRAIYWERSGQPYVAGLPFQIPEEFAEEAGQKIKRKLVDPPF